MCFQLLWIFSVWSGTSARHKSSVVIGIRNWCFEHENKIRRRGPKMFINYIIQARICDSIHRQPPLSSKPTRMWVSVEWKSSGNLRSSKQRTLFSQLISHPPTTSANINVRQCPMSQMWNKHKNYFIHHNEDFLVFVSRPTSHIWI